MEIEFVKTDDVKQYAKNAKKHPEEQVSYIANSIKEFGFRQPLVIDKDNVIVIGHGRYLAAKKLGLEVVPCVRATDLSEQQIKALRIADNKTSEKGSWDDALLSEEIKSLIEDMDMTDFGFGDFELSMMTEDFEPEPFDDEIIKEYEANAEEHLAKRRVIITYTDDQEEALKALLGLEEIKKVVYDVGELQK